MSRNALSAEHIISVLHCAECENPLARDPQGGSYCTRCKFAPSMQDTYIQYTCRCGGHLKGNGDKSRLICERCEQTYR